MAPDCLGFFRYQAARHLGKILPVLKGKKWSLYLLKPFGSCFTV